MPSTSSPGKCHSLLRAAHASYMPMYTYSKFQVLSVSSDINNVLLGGKEATERHNPPCSYEQELVS